MTLVQELFRIVPEGIIPSFDRRGIISGPLCRDGRCGGGSSLNSNNREVMRLKAQRANDIARKAVEHHVRAGYFGYLGRSK